MPLGMRGLFSDLVYVACFLTNFSDRAIKIFENHLAVRSVMLPVLKCIMPDNNFLNMVDLVDGVSILNSDSISHKDIAYAGLVLTRFCKAFQDLYGKRHMSSNFHLLRHLHENVRDLGPLFFTSCFTFEDLNGKLANLAHGTRHAGLKIAKHLNSFSELDLKVSELPDGLPKKFCETLSRKSRLFVTEKLSEKLFVVEIISFVRVNMPFSSDILVLLREILVESFCVRHMKKIVGSSEPRLAALHDLETVCFKVKVDDAV
ncbi:Capsid protein, partial [Frankliniella fusca]